MRGGHRENAGRKPGVKTGSYKNPSERRVRHTLSLPSWVLEALKKTEPNINAYIKGLIMSDKGWEKNGE